MRTQQIQAVVVTVGMAIFGLGACGEEKDKSPRNSQTSLEDARDAAIENAPDDSITEAEAEAAFRASQAEAEADFARDCGDFDPEDRPLGSLTGQPCEPSPDPICSPTPESDSWAYECHEGALRVYDFSRCHPSGQVTCIRRPDGSVVGRRRIFD